jgi:hypothetical protein
LSLQFYRSPSNSSNNTILSPRMPPSQTVPPNMAPYQLPSRTKQLPSRCDGRVDSTTLSEARPLNSTQSGAGATIKNTFRNEDDTSRNNHHHGNTCHSRNNRGSASNSRSSSTSDEDDDDDDDDDSQEEEEIRQRQIFTSPRCIMSDDQIFPTNKGLFTSKETRWKQISELAGQHRQDGSVLTISRNLTPQSLKSGVTSQMGSRVRRLNLWFNHNQDILPEWLDVIATLFPNLEHLTFSEDYLFPDEDTMVSSRMRRLYVLYRLPDLLSIDEMPVTKKERQLARPNDPNGEQVEREDWVKDSLLDSAEEDDEEDDAQSEDDEEDKNDAEDCHSKLPRHSFLEGQSTSQEEDRDGWTRSERLIMRKALGTNPKDRESFLHNLSGNTSDSSDNSNVQSAAMDKYGVPNELVGIDIITDDVDIATNAGNEHHDKSTCSALCDANNKADSTNGKDHGWQGTATGTTNSPSMKTPVLQTNGSSIGDSVEVDLSGTARSVPLGPQKPKQRSDYGAKLSSLSRNEGKRGEPSMSDLQLAPIARSDTIDLLSVAATSHHDWSGACGVLNFTACTKGQLRVAFGCQAKLISRDRTKLALKNSPHQRSSPPRNSPPQQKTLQQSSPPRKSGGSKSDARKTLARPERNSPPRKIDGSSSSESRKRQLLHKEKAQLGPCPSVQRHSSLTSTGGTCNFFSDEAEVVRKGLGESCGLFFPSEEYNPKDAGLYPGSCSALSRPTNGGPSQNKKLPPSKSLSSPFPLQFRAPALPSSAVVPPCDEQVVVITIAVDSDNAENDQPVPVSPPSSPPPKSSKANPSSTMETIGSPLPLSARAKSTSSPSNTTNRSSLPISPTSKVTTKPPPCPGSRRLVIGKPLKSRKPSKRLLRKRMQTSKRTARSTSVLDLAEDSDEDLTGSDEEGEEDEEDAATQTNSVNHLPEEEDESSIRGGFQASCCSLNS